MAAIRSVRPDPPGLDRLRGERHHLHLRHGEADPDLDVRHALLLGDDRRGELRGLAEDDVRPPLPHGRAHTRQHRANGQRREDLTDDEPLGLVVGQRRDPSPYRAELLLRRCRAAGERVPGALHRLGDARRPDHEHLVPATPAGLDERGHRMEVPGAASAGEQDAHRATVTPGCGIRPARRPYTRTTALRPSPLATPARPCPRARRRLKSFPLPIVRAPPWVIGWRGAANQLLLRHRDLHLLERGDALATAFPRALCRGSSVHRLERPPTRRLATAACALARDGVGFPTP